MFKYAFFIALFWQVNLFSQSETVIGNLGNPQSITTKDNFIFFSELDPPRISKYDLSTNELIWVIDAPELGPSHGLASNEDYIFISSFETGQVFRVDDGLDVPQIELLIDQLNGPKGLFVEDNFLYIAEWYDFEITRLNLNTYQTELIA